MYISSWKISRQEASWVTKMRVFRKISMNNIALQDTEKTSGILKIGGIAYFLLLKILKIQETQVSGIW